MPGDAMDMNFHKIQKKDLTDHSQENVEIVKRITWIGMVANLLLSALKLTVGILGSSQALIADAIHSLSDISTDLAILFGVRYWSAPADECHPYGHRRIETLVTALIGLVLAAVAAGIGYNALLTIQSIHETKLGWIAFIGAAVSIVVKEILYHWTVAAGRKAKSPALIANAWHHRTDAFSSIPVAITVVVAIISPNWSFLDHVGAIVVSVFILHVALGILKSSFTELTDGGVSTAVREQIKNLAMENQQVCSVHAVRSRRVGPGIHVDLHILVDRNLTVREGHDISEQVKQHLIDNGPDVVDVVVHLEPDDV